MRTKLLFGVHCHQPVENFYSVVDHAVHSCYKPFLETCFQNENFKFSVHFSGWVLNYIKDHFRDTFDLIKKMADRGQIEFFSGGYYEPVLSAISSKDRKLQINKLNKYIYNNFGLKPTGAWLTERVWDPSIIPDLVDEGIEYITVDDYHFLSIGYKKEEMFSYYITEQDGSALKIFPIDKNLRYMVPFRRVEEVLDYLRFLSKMGDGLAVIFDDGEKFGVWPGTNDWVYNQGWLRKFIEAICNDDAIETAHFVDTVNNTKPANISYLPLTAYMEMGQWSLSADAWQLLDELFDFLNSNGLKDKYFYLVKGGIWKNFFAKYPESNHLHKRIMNLSKLADSADDNKKIKEALLKAECNDVFWHGIFGGIYLPNLRNNAYKFLIEAESLYDKKSGVKYPSVEIKDINLDGYDELILKNDNTVAVFSSKYCGQMQEFDIKDIGFNLQNTMSRRKEGYHKTILNYSATDSNKQEGISTIHEMNLSATEEAKANIIYDWYNRYSFIDHFVEHFSLEQFIYMNFGELGDFVNQPSNIKKKKQHITFEREGSLFFDGQHYNAAIIKEYKFEDLKLKADINVTAEVDKSIFYVLEFNFHFYDFGNITVNGINTRETSKCKAKAFVFTDSAIKKEIIMEFDDDVELYWYFVKTVSQSEKGVDLTDQAMCILVPFELSKKLNISVYLGCKS